MSDYTDRLDIQSKKELLRGALGISEGGRQPAPSLAHYHGYRRGAAGALPDWQEATWEAPAGRASVQSDVIVPLLQAIVTGIFCGVAVGILAGVLFDAMFRHAMAAAGVTVLVVTGVMWARLLDDSRRLLRSMETLTRRDLDGDGLIGQPETLRVEVSEPGDGGYGGIVISDLPVSREVLASHARSVAGGAHKWSRRDLASHPSIGSDRARQLLEALEAGGFLHYPDGRRHPDGAQLTARGRALMRGLVE